MLSPKADVGDGSVLEGGGVRRGKCPTYRPVLSARPDVGRSVVLRSRSLESGGALQSSRGRRPADGPRRPTRTRRAALVVRSDRTKPIRTKLRRGDHCVCGSAVARSRLLSPA